MLNFETIKPSFNDELIEGCLENHLFIKNLKLVEC
jgi:hypothetical protein